MPSQSKLPTILIILATLAVVFGPVFVPREISRWYLAAAHNAYRIRDSVLAEHYLQQAESWDPNIKSDADYWIAQLPRASEQDPDQLLDLIERAVMTDSRWKLRAKQTAEIYSESFDFAHAVRALKIAAVGQRPTTAEDLNELAYMRALAGMELADALKDVDLAIDMVGPLPSLLDTKAWVLYRMKRNLEALGYMNEAIKGIELEFDKLKIPLPEPLQVELPQAADGQPSEAGSLADSKLWTLQFIDRPDEPEPFSRQQRRAEIDQARKRVGEAGYVLAVMRFHRLRILEALGEDRQAAQDRRWLIERGVPIVDQLF